MLVLCMRHAQRADEVDDEPWPGQADRPHDPPLSAAGREQARAAGADLAAVTAAAHPSSTRLVTSHFLRCLQTAAGVLAGLRGDGDDETVSLEVDPALGEIAGPPFITDAPWAGCAEPRDWAWTGGSPASALAAAGLPLSTPIITPAAWPSPPETLEAGHARYDRAIAAAAARAAADATPTTTLILITHGEAVRRAVTRVCPSACVYEVAHCGWVGCEWTEGEEGGGGCDDTWALLPAKSAGVGWLDPTRTVE